MEVAVRNLSELAAGLPKLVAPRQNPAQIYLSGLSKTGRRAIASQLRFIAAMVGADSLESVPWHELKHEHVVALRTKALELGRSAATVNLMLSAIRGAVRTAWNMGLISAEDLARVEAVKGVKSFTEPKGRRITSGELVAIMKRINAEIPSGKRDAALIGLSYCGGLRRQEIASLQLESINDLGEEMEITIKAGKGRKDRVLIPEQRGSGCFEGLPISQGKVVGFTLLGILEER